MQVGAAGFDKLAQGSVDLEHADCIGASASGLE
jgi:hypothetical protein